MRKRPKITENRFDQFAADLKDWIRASVSPFENDTPEKQKERVTRSKTDLLYFCLTYVPHYCFVDFGEFHEEWDGLTELRDEVVLIAAPREHAKSTFFSFFKPLQNICHVLRRFQLLISDTNDQATGFTLPILLELEENPRIRHDFGDLRGRVWKKNDFTTASGVRTLARGRGEKVRGLKNMQYRPDYAGVDDFENDVNVENPAQVNKGLKWLRRAVIGSMGAGYTFVMVGNLFHPKSVLSQLIAAKNEDGSLQYVSRVYDCWIDYGKPSQRPLWPALWPPERLVEKQRVMGPVDFNAEMRNLTGAEDSPFREAWFRYFDRIELVDRILSVASFVDPSATSHEKSDFKAVITVGLERTDELIVRCLHAWIRRATVGEMFAAAYHQVDHYGGSMGIEENMLKDFLHEAIKQEALRRNRYLPWAPVHHTGNKRARVVGGLSYLVEHGLLLFEKGHSDQDLLIEQLIYIDNDNVNDDGPDALEGAVALVQGAGQAVCLGINPTREETLLQRHVSQPGTGGMGMRARVSRGGFGMFRRGH